MHSLRWVSANAWCWGGFTCAEGHLLAVVLHPRPATHLTGRVAFLSWLCACVLMQVIRSGGARLGQLPPAMAGVAMPLGACAATLLTLLSAQIGMIEGVLSAPF